MEENQLKNDGLEEFINDKLVSENFSDEQKAIIKQWLEEAYYFGQSTGRTESICNFINNEQFSKYKQLIDKLFSASGYADDVTLKNLIMLERHINALQNSEVSTLLYMMDKERFGMAFGTCPKS